LINNQSVFGCVLVVLLSACIEQCAVSQDVGYLQCIYNPNTLFKNKNFIYLHLIIVFVTQVLL